MAKEVDVQVRYIPDTSALKNALSGTQNIDFKIGGSGLKKELLTPVQNAMKEVNKALASGADNKTLLKLFQDVGKAADSAKLKATGMLTEINSGFNSAGNQKLLKDLEQYQKELDKVEKKIANWDSKYGNKKMSQMKSDLGIGGIADAKKELEEQLKIEGNLTKEAQARVEALKEYVDTWNKRKELADNGITKGGMESDASVLRGKISDIMKTVELPQSNVEWTKQLTPIINTLGQAAGLSTQEINKLTNAINNEDKAAKAAIDENKKEALRLADVVTGTFLGTNISSLFTSALRRGVEFFKEYDETLTRTMMVTGMARDEVNELTTSYNKLANQLSSTTKDVAAAQLVFYQQGLGTSEALKMTEASIAISKTGGIEAGEAANRLTAAVRGYKMAANDAMSIADKMSALDAAAASSVDELTIAMQKSASQARMAGLDLDYYMAYLSTMQEVTREAPENIGTAMKSITSRLQEITDLGAVEEDGTTFSNVAKALNSVGIAAVDSSGQLRQLQDIMNELGPMWNTLDKNHKAYLATTLAGNRQQSRFIALMDNYDRAMELVSVSQNASGESAKQLRAYNQGLEASFTRLSNAWQQFATKIANSDTIKGIIDLLADFVEMLNKIPKPITQAVIPLMALSKGFQLFKNAGSLFGEFKGAIGKKLGIDSLTSDAQKMNKTLSDSSSALGKWGNTLAKALNGIGNRTGELKEVSDMTDTYTNALIRNTASTDASTVAKLKNNATNASEVGEASAITSGEIELAEAYDKATKSIALNQEALDNNNLSYFAEYDEQYKTAKSKLEEAQKNASKQKDLLFDYDADYKFERQNIVDKYKNMRSSAALPGAARQALKDEGKRATTENLQLKQNELLQQYKKDEKVELDKLKQAAQELMTQCESAIDAAEKEIKEALDVMNKRRATIQDSGQIEIPEGVEIPDGLKKGVKVETPKSLVSDSQKTDFANLGNVLKNENIGNIAKAKTAIGELGKTINMTSISSGVMIGSLVNMGGQALGLDDDLSGALGTFAGLGKTLSGFGPWGWAAAAGIAALQFGFKKLYPSVEEVEEKLTDLASKRDEISQKINDIDSAKDTYKELRNNLNKTEEEQQRFNDAIEVLQKEVPGAISGYDAMGNAIINLSKVTEELNKQQEALIENSKNTLKEFTKLQSAEGSNGWTKTADVLSVIEYIGNPIGKIAEDLIGSPITMTGMIQKHLVEPFEYEARKKVWAEKFSEIYSNLQTMISDTIDKGNSKNKDLRQKLSDSVLNIFMAEGMEKGLEVDEVQKQVEELFNKFHYGDLDNLITVSTQIKANAEMSDKSWADTKEMVTKQLAARFKSLDLSDEEFQAILKATLKMTYAGNVDIDSVIEQIDAEIDRRGDIEFNLNGQKFKYIIQNADASVVDAMDNLDLLNSTFVNLISKYDDLSEIENIFRGTNGEIDKQKAGLILLNDAYNDLEKEQEAHQLNGEGGLYEQRDNLEDEIKKKKEEIAKLQIAYNKADVAASGEVGYGTEHKKLDYEAKPNLEAAKKELEELEKKWNEVNTETEKSEDAVKDYQTVINQLISNFESVQAPSFSELADDIRDIASQLKSVQDIAEALDDQAGRMSLDNIADMFEILGSYEEDAMKNAQTWDLWNSSIEKINNGLSVQNGELIAQKGVMEGLNDLTQVSAKIKMQQIEASIEQNQLELELQNAALQTEAAAIQAAIDELNASKDTNKAKEAIDTSMSELQANLNKVEAKNKKDTFDIMLSYTSQFASQYSKILSAAYSGKYDGTYEKLKDQSDKIVESFKKDLADEIKGNIIDGDVDASVANLTNRLNQVNAQISMNNKTINNTLELKKKISSYLASDTTNLAAQVDKASDSQDKYNEKLERTLTLLEKIEGLQHTIDENETFKDLYDGYSGEDYGRLLMTNLSLAQQQYDVYKDLFAMQQEMTDQAAGDLLDSPYGSMFKIMENGDIGWADASMYDKYKNLPNDMKEDIDNLVEAFQKQRDALRDTEQDLSKYAKEVKKVREELVEMEITIENWLVDALKNREKIMNDARQKALDDEIDMIEKAVEARKKANDRENQNKDLYKAQEALRRATLDSSGKNNAQLLQLQQDLEDKQLEIAEKRFEDDMDDRKQWLQDTKDAEQETYEYRLETMTWYWEQVQEIQAQGTEAMMETLIHWNEEYNTQSQLQQEEMEREWFNTMEAMREATDMGAELDALTRGIVDVTTEVESMNISISALPGTWQKATDAANAYANAAKSASSYRYGGNGAEFSSDNDNNTKDPIPEQTPKSKFSVGDRLKSNAGAIIPYEQQKDGSFKQKGWLSAMSVYDVTVDEVKYSNGSYYYKVRDGNKTVWFNGYQLKKYKTGGYVDYTGPAWVDGTTSHPEAFLNAYQTEQIGALAETLDGNSINNVSGDTVVSFGSINFNVASMSSSADGQKALDVFVKGANDLMAKKGISTTLNMNVK